MSAPQRSSTVGCSFIPHSLWREATLMTMRSIFAITPAYVYFGRAESILAERQRIKRAIITNRRLQHQPQAA